MAHFIGVTGSDNKAIDTFAREFVINASKDKTNWVIVKISDIVKAVIIRLIKEMVKEAPVIRNDFFVKSIRNSMTILGDDFWMGAVVKHIDELVTRGYDNFVITEISNRGEHYTIRDLMEGKMIYINNGSPSEFCTYPTNLVEFDLYVEFVDADELRTRMDDIVRVATTKEEHNIDTNELTTYINEEGERVEVKPLDSKDESVLYQ